MKKKIHTKAMENAWRLQKREPEAKTDFGRHLKKAWASLKNQQNISTN
ncbi:MAG: hypothetical protein FWD56_00435 [Bacteroidales bacterium]|nr:hypothetical protein [Bacteroidales bacterium]